MKVFMSWSGQRSKLTAELLYGWVKCVIQAAQPWISSKGIERGALWFSEINNELKDTSVGIICISQENKNAPWILFESGALAKGLATNRVCTFLIDLQPADLQPPLAQFNHTLPNRDSMWSLVSTLNTGLEGNRLAPEVLDRVFETYWPQFESGFAAILANNPPVTVVAPREEKDILAEILETTRSMSKRVRTLEDRNKAQLMSNARSDFFSNEAAHIAPRFYGGGEIVDRSSDSGSGSEVDAPTLSRLLASTEKAAPGAVGFALNLFNKGVNGDTIQENVITTFGVTKELAVKITGIAQLIKINLKDMPD